MKGELHKVMDIDGSVLLFDTDLSKPGSVILIGGLTDGFCGMPFTTHFQQGFEPLGYSICQVHLTSSFTGFGFSSVRKDALELSEIMNFLRTKGKKKFILVGHSTGCQDIIRLAEVLHRNNADFDVVSYVLQAPASDRQYIENSGVFDEAIAEAVERRNAGENVAAPLSRTVFGCAVSIERCLSLASKESDDDCFSSDLSNEYLDKMLRHVRRPCLIVHSLNDEFVFNKEVVYDFFNRKLLQVLHKYSPHSKNIFLAGPHILLGSEQELVDQVKSFVLAVK